MDEANAASLSNEAHGVAADVVSGAFVLLARIGEADNDEIARAASPKRVAWPTKGHDELRRSASGLRCAARARSHDRGRGLSRGTNALGQNNVAHAD